VIDHGNGEFSVLSHLQRDSVRVGVGDRVRAGDAIARCGNSGASTEPHVQYHLQDGPVIGTGLGLPAHFRGYTADGDAVERGEPRRGQFVRGA
jgi:murein DD-endopeptidase MepM/ murein hydrolase activator NlpD